jgi:hypothetical protein
MRSRSTWTMSLTVGAAPPPLLRARVFALVFRMTTLPDILIRPYVSVPLR